ncbi:MAG: ribonuclease III [Phycisphaerales bacterium]|nr:ribonuclease III [Phycisphaerales bacterium]
MNDALLDTAESLLGYSFNDRQFLSRALTHASSADCRLQSNERMEFLGDAVLGLVVVEYLHATYPDLLEGDLTKIKSSVVSRRTCAEAAIELGLEGLLVLGKGMGQSERLPASVAAAAWEAAIGAIYLDGGLEPARVFILDALRQRIEAGIELGHHHNYKSMLQQHAQRTFNRSPVYAVLDEQGPDHAKCFEVAVTIDGRQFPGRWGASKKRAEQEAALSALQTLGLMPPDDPRPE